MRASWCAALASIAIACSPGAPPQQPSDGAPPASDTPDASDDAPVHERPDDSRTGVGGRGGSGGGGAGASGLSVAGEHFALDGEERFLLGISYFSCLYAPKQILEADFDAFAQHGLTIVRCWMDWPIHYDTWETESSDNVVLIAADGSLDAAALSRLELVLALAHDRGLVVDMTFNQDTPNKTHAAHKAGIVAAEKALEAETDVLFDLQNEADHAKTDPDLFMDEAQALAARNAVKNVDPSRLVTASTRSTASLGSYTTTAALDLGAYHCCRNVGTITDWAAATLPAVHAARDALGPGIPIYLQEPNRCGTGKQYATCNGDGSEFVTAAKNAKKGGAAAWVFHTTAGYDLRTQTLWAQLDATELDALEQLAAAVAATKWGP